MKKTLLFFFLLVCSLDINAQAMKPTVMVIPHKNWCFQNNYTKRLSINGGTKVVPDYERAFLEDQNLSVAISTINTFWINRGYPLVNMDKYLDNIDLTNAENVAATSKSGADIAITPLDIINQRAKADITLDLNYSINRRGPYQSVTVTIEANDAYTKKSIASASGTGDRGNSGAISTYIQEAIGGSMDQIMSHIDNYFRDLEVNGREVGLTIRLWDDCPYDLEEEFGGVELREIIEDWVADNTVKGRYTIEDNTETTMNFTQVRIPLYNERGRAINAMEWSRGLAKYLKTKGIQTKVGQRGLGLAILTIGGK